MSRIIVTAGLPEEGFDRLRKAGHSVVMPAPLTYFTKPEMLTLLPDADAVVAANAFDADMIHAAKKLKHIANYGAGYDAVNIREAALCGIPVTNIPDAVTEATAELAFGLMLAVCRRIGEMNLRLRSEVPESLFGLGKNMAMSVKGLTLGIIGAGRIGGRMAEMSKAFGMNVIGYSRRGADPSAMTPASFDEVIERSDVLSVHCPLTPETRGIISREVMARMKKGAVLINTARGGVIDNDALYDMVKSGHLYGAGLDVFPDEPHVPAKLLELQNIVVTPHYGTNTLQARNNMADACCVQILDVLEGKRPSNIVNGL